MSAVPEHVPLLTDVVAPQDLGSAPAAGAAQPLTVSAELIPVLADRIAELSALHVSEASVEAREHSGPEAPGGTDIALHPVPSMDREALEARLLEGLKASVAKMLETRVQTAVTPALALLADRLAYKASQELAASLTQSMHEELLAAVKASVDEALGPQGQ